VLVEDIAVLHAAAAATSIASGNVDSGPLRRRGWASRESFVNAMVELLDWSVWGA